VLRGSEAQPQSKHPYTVIRPPSSPDHQIDIPRLNEVIPSKARNRGFRMHRDGPMTAAID